MKTGIQNVQCKNSSLSSPVVFRRRAIFLEYSPSCAIFWTLFNSVHLSPDNYNDNNSNNNNSSGKKAHWGPGPANRLLISPALTSEVKKKSNLFRNDVWPAHRVLESLLSFRSELLLQISSYPSFAGCWLGTVTTHWQWNSSPTRIEPGLIPQYRLKGICLKPINHKSIWRSEVRIPVLVRIFLLKSKNCNFSRH